MTVTTARSARRIPLVVVGDSLLDRDLEGNVERLSPEAAVPVVEEPRSALRPGGAALAAALAARDGREVTFVTALANDEPAHALRAMLERLGIRVVALGLAGATPEKVRIRARGRTLVRVDRNCAAGRPDDAGPQALEALHAAAGVLVSDYGQGLARGELLRATLERLPADVPLVWDPHPRGPEPVPGALVVTPNSGEAARFAPDEHGDGIEAVARRGRTLAARWRAVNVCVTLDARGALLVGGPGAPLAVPAPRVAAGDVSGAGDRFASAVTGMLADGALVMDAVAHAVELSSAFVADGGASAALADRPRGSLPHGGDAAAAIAAVRAAGGTVVATGGCFDLIHAGHVRMLQSARALGDCLVVCLNSDRSVRRLKGAGRPLVREADRASVLLALDCVDAVVIFDEATPEAALERLRPDVFAKGADYAGRELPEAAVMRRWGGQVVTVPYVAGRSTTGLIREVSGLAG
jgi:rfaE bifunctional protein nucleotidyltransferase chain/domain/rfaE bifunctional protein kinase chain/domain